MSTDQLLAQLSLAEKCAMVAGRDIWTIPGCERLGIPEWTVSDGPVGVRGRLAGPGLVVPGPSALAATWDPGLVADVGAALGQECIDKHIDVLLGPTVNLHRSPRNGRHFESYSEDPELSARIAVGYIRGVQSTGVGACVKHLVANDQETDRFTVDVQVDERSLREIYLPPFEAAVREADVRFVMGAYNFVNGHQACAHPELLIDLLKDEWGFDGVVISDWSAIKETVAPARNGLDVEMPGPGRWWGNGQLQAAVERGEVDEKVLDDKVRRVLEFLEWRGRLTGPDDSSEAPVDRPEHRALARRAATESIVLLHDRVGMLPLSPEAIGTVAVIGPGAAHTSLLGGGSASLTPHRRTDVLSALRQRLGDDRITVAVGAHLRRRPVSLPSGLVTGDGLVAELYAGRELTGEPFTTFHPEGAYNLWIKGGDPWPADVDEIAVRLRATVVPEVSGPHYVMGAGIGQATLLLDGQAVTENRTDPLPAGLALRGGLAEVALEAGRTYELVLEHTVDRETPATVIDIGFEPVPPSGDALVEEAVRAAAAADVAVVVVGTSDEWESEGVDRAELELPRGQDELVRRVAAANPRTVVVLNCGAPTLLPWLDEVGAALLAWYPGQEGGEAIVDVLLGDADPGGRMPTTWARREQDTPSFTNFPGEAGAVRYGEGIFVGYRWYDARGIEPLLPFGHGGSYARFEWGPPTVSGTAGTAGLDPDVVVEVPVTNVSDRAGVEVVQVYVAAPDPLGPPVQRAPKELAGFAKLRLAAGESTTARIPLRRRAFARWDPGAHVEASGWGPPPGGWTVDPGSCRLLVAASAVDIRAELEVSVER